MTSYTVRVELHQATDNDYAKLHAKMEARGFVRWVLGDSGEKSQLPTAEYNMQDTKLKRSDVHALAKSAAVEVKPTPAPWVLTTESSGRTWSNLKPWKG